MTKAKKYIDPQGNEIPGRYVSDIDKLRDTTVEQCFSIFIELQRRMKKDKAKIMRLIALYEKKAWEQYGHQRRGEKGNLTLSSFNSKRKIERSNQNFVDFDDRLQMAVQLIRECIYEWSTDIKSPVKVIIEKVLKPDKKGKMPLKGIKTLKQLNIQDNDKWTQAMKLLTEAEKNVESRFYYRAFERLLDNSWENVTVDFSSIEPDIDPEG